MQGPTDSDSSLPAWANYYSSTQTAEVNHHQNSVITLKPPQLMIIEEQMGASDAGAEVMSIPIIQDQVSGELGEMTSS